MCLNGREPRQDQQPLHGRLAGAVVEEAVAEGAQVPLKLPKR